MRATVLGVLTWYTPLLALAEQQPPAPIIAQGPTIRVDGPIPADVVSEAADVYNATATIRVSGRLEVAAGQELGGDVAVLNGPIVVSGRVAGRLVAINANVVVRPTGRIDGGVLVVGGRLERVDGSTVTGPVREYRRLFWYHLRDEQLVPEREQGGERECLICGEPGPANDSRLTVAAKGYDRVEGLPVLIGPKLRHSWETTALEVEVLGVIRSAENFHWDSENIGHSVGAELRRGAYRGVALGGRLFDLVAPVEDWQMPGSEAALATVFLRRDYRDYYNRHGGALTATLFSGPEVELSVQYASELWASRRARDPWSLFRNSDPWRPNPAVEEGRVTVTNAHLTLDTRNDNRNPWAGWFGSADIEWGHGRLTPPAASFALPRDAAYRRVLIDVRRYNRLSRNAQLNMRILWGGRLGGDSLPLQRRFSVGGPATLPGYAFRGITGDPDVGQCSVGPVLPGSPALCERVALAQLEYRGALSFGLSVGSRGENGDDDGGWRLGWRDGAQWVAFVDAGRGWVVGPRSGDLRYPGNTLLPRAGTFRTDVGLGIDLGQLGLYVAKPVSQKGQRTQFFIRLGHRF